jgi:hypothetical protein
MTEERATSFVEQITRFLWVILITGFLFAAIYFDKAGYAGLFGIFLGTALERLTEPPQQPS